MFIYTCIDMGRWACLKMVSFPHTSVICHHVPMKMAIWGNAQFSDKHIVYIYTHPILLFHKLVVFYELHSSYTYTNYVCIYIYTYIHTSYPPKINA